MLRKFELGFRVMLGAVGLASAQTSPDRLLGEANAAYRSLQASQAVSLYRQYLARNPDRADVHAFLGGALLNLGQRQAAFEEAKRAMDLNGSYAKGYILAGRVCASRGQWERAQNFFDTAQHLDEHDFDSWYFSGRAYYDANRFERAVAAFEEAIRRGTEQSRIYENLGLSQDALQQFDKAETSFAEAVKRADGTWRPYLSYGAFLFRQGRPSESLQVLRQALAFAPAAEDVRFELARVLYHENKLTEAALVLEPARSSNQCRVHNLLARIYSLSGRNHLAEREVKAIEDCKGTSP